MTLLTGVDGCDYGWICITNDLNNGAFSSQLFKSASELFKQTPQTAIFTINIPIGLSDSGPRQCDILAKQVLNRGRRKSVFDAPVRQALSAHNYKEATYIQSSITGRGLNLFTWSQLPKIIDVDCELQKDAELRNKVYETHAELSLLEMNGRKRINNIPI